MAATINNNSVSMSVQDILPALLRLCDPGELAEYESTPPATLGYLANYRGGVAALQCHIVRTAACGGAIRLAVFEEGCNVDAVEGAIDLNGTLTQRIFLSFQCLIL